ncbi:MAG TPA: YeeE/YedE family protein, partial [Actinomycetota bacterium]|nr:YeeE/YedE family protein [Actinomycetota bacterium]
MNDAGLGPIPAVGGAVTAAALLTSSPALGALALGLPLAVLALSAIWGRPGRGLPVRAAASAIVAVAVV